jgi:hypothetical protein
VFPAKLNNDRSLDPVIGKANLIKTVFLIVHITSQQCQICCAFL